MRKAALLAVGVVVGIGTAAATERAETALRQAGPLIGGATAPTGYTLPFDAAATPLAAPLGPLMAFGPSSPEESNTGLSIRKDDEDHD